MPLPFLKRTLANELAAAVLILIALVLSAAVWWLSSYSRSILEDEAVQQIREKTDLVAAMIDSYDAALKHETGQLMRVLESEFKGPFSLSSEQRVRVGDLETPTLRNGDRILNLSFSALDDYTASTGAVATVFVRDGDDFVRIATSLEDEQGRRAIGTMLGKTHPGYARLMAGQAFVGKARLFGRDYMTQYSPILVDGKVVGLLFVGIDFSKSLAALKDEIHRLKIGDSGYFFVLDAAPGSHSGELLVHPSQEGRLVSEDASTEGHDFLAKMLKTESGALRYFWVDPTHVGDAPREKIVAFKAYAPWGWIIAGGTYLGEIARNAVLLRNAMLAGAVVLLLAVGGVLAYMTRRLVTRPLAQVAGIFGRIGAGDYGSVIETARSDEIGALLKSLEQMQGSLAERDAKDRASAREMQRRTCALDKASTNIMVADRDGTLVYLNDAFVSMMREAETDIRRDLPRFSAQGLLGRSYADLHTDGAQQLALLADLRGTYVAQIRVGGRTFKLVANPVRDAEGARLGTVVEWVDRTAEVAAEGELDALLDAVARGDFSQRLGAEGKTGFFRDLAEGMNHLTEIVSRALDELADVLQAVARADLTRKIESRYHGRFADLKNDTNTTVEQLEALVRGIQEATQTIDTAAAEISAGNADLSERTEEQASSLEETASSMEELSATIQQNAQNAQAARALVRDANDKALAGGDLVSRVVATMGSIQRSSDHIADITGVIDSIAFQTNILALNAAVEAARAGEQGRGFAVVAGEVRALAQRSAQAAKEIKQLIGDSVTKVEDGARLAQETGTTMEAIVSSFQRVVTLVSEIADASREQGAGVAQVTQAVTLMDEATQRNAALVEEAAAAAESLEDQAKDLTQTVSVFKIRPAGDGRDAVAGVAEDGLSRISGGRAIHLKTSV